MTTMNISMTLGLVDTASPQVKAFIGTLDSLLKAVVAVSERLTATVGGITGVSSASASAESTVGRLGATIAAVAAETRQLTIDSLLAGEAMLKQSIDAIKLEGSMAAAGAASATAGARIAGAGNDAVVATGKVGTLGTALKGMAELWAALKIERGLAGSIDASSEYQQLEARLKALNRPESENREFLSKAAGSSNQLGFVSLNEAIESRLAAVAGLGRNAPEEIDATINEALKAAIIFKLRGDKSEIKDLVRNLYGVAEMRGQTSDPAAMNATFDLLQRAGTASQNKLTLKDMETVTRQLKYGGGAMIDDEGMALIFAFANQLKAAGMGGGGAGGSGVTQAGTAATQVLKWAEGGIQNKEAVRLLTAMGLLDASQVRGDSSTTDVNVGPKALRDSQLAARNPIQWLMAMAPIMLKFVQDNQKQFFGGKDINDPKAQDEALTKLAIMLTAGKGGVNVGNMLAQAILPGPSSRLTAEQTLTREAKPIEPALGDLNKTWGMQVEKFTASIETLKTTIGLQLLPALTAMLKSVNEILAAMNAFGKDHPFITQMVAIGAIITSAGLAVAGFISLFGFMNIGLSALGGAATTAGGAITGLGAASTAAAGLVATLGTLLLGGVAVTIAGFAGWFIGSWLKDMEVGKKPIELWASDMMENLATIFKGGWLRILQDEASFMAGLAQSAIKGSIEYKAGGWLVGRLQGKQAPVDTSIGPPLPTDAERYAGSGRGAMYGDSYYHQELSPEAQRRREMAAKGLGVVTKPIDYSKAARGKPYDEAAEQAKQDLRLEEADRKRALHDLDVDYKAGAISIRDYYDGLTAASREATANEIDAIQRRIDAMKAEKKPDKAAIKGLETDIILKQAAADDAAINNQMLKEKALDALKQKGIDLDREAMSASGRKHEADLLHLQQQMDARIKDFEINRAEPGGEERLSRAKTDKDAAISALQYNQEYEKVTAIKNQESLKDEEINNLVKSGQLTESEAADARFANHTLFAHQLEDEIALLKTLADASGDPKLQFAVAQLAVQIKGTLTELSPLVQQIKSVFSGAFTGLFENIMSGTKNAKTIFLDFFNSIAKGIDQIVAKILADKVANALFGGAGAGLTGGSGLDFGSILSKFLGFGGASAGGSPIANFGAGDSFGGGLGGFATGIDYVPRDMLAYIHQGERVVTKADNQSMNGGGMLRPVIIQHTINAPVNNRSRAQVAAASMDGLRMAQRIR